MRLPSSLRGFLAAMLLFSLLCFGTEAFCRWILHWHEPYDYPGIRAYYFRIHTRLRFGDFHEYFEKFAFFHSRLFYTEYAVLPYPAPALVAYKLFLVPRPHTHHGSWALFRFIGSLLLSSWLMLWLWSRALVKAGLSRSTTILFLLVTYMLSFPFWFEFMQGNIEWVVWVVLSLGIWAFYRGHFRTAAVCIGIAGSMKIFPLIFVGLFLPVRRYRDAALTLLSAAVSTVVSLWLVCPDIVYSWRQTILALTHFEQQAVTSTRGFQLGFDHSLFALIKSCLNDLLGMQAPQKFVGTYMLIVALGGILLFFTRIRHLPLTNQVLCLSIAAILLPPVSYDYTLVHLYAGLALLTLVAVTHWRKDPGQRVPGLLPALLLLAFLLAPESELIWHGNRYAAQFKALALLALGFLALRWPFVLSSTSGLPRLSADRLTGVLNEPAEAVRFPA